MNPFTDHDLKQLKEGYWFKRVSTHDIGQSESFVWCDGDKVLALLARLEAAEMILSKIQKAKIDQNCELRASDLYIEDWRKAAGK